MIRSRDDDRARALVSLRQAGQSKGRWLRQWEWIQEDRSPSVDVIRRLFGSWAGAWAAAGYSVTARWARERPVHRWTREEALQRIQQAAARSGGTLSSTVWARQHMLPVHGTIRHLFGSWSEAVRQAGVAPEETVDAQPAKITTALAVLWVHLGRAPARPDWEAWPDKPGPSSRVIRLFGSWRRALVQASASRPGLSSAHSRSAAVAHLLALPDEVLTDRQRVLANLFRRGATLGQAGQEMGLTRERVRQIAARAGGGRHRPPRRRSPPRSGGRSNLDAPHVSVTAITDVHWGRPGVPLIPRTLLPVVAEEPIPAGVLSGEGAVGPLSVFAAQRLIMDGTVEMTKALEQALVAIAKRGMERCRRETVMPSSEHPFNPPEGVPWPGRVRHSILRRRGIEFVKQATYGDLLDMRQIGAKTILEMGVLLDAVLDLVGEAPAPDRVHVPESLGDGGAGAPAPRVPLLEPLAQPRDKAADSIRRLSITWFENWPPALRRQSFPAHEVRLSPAERDAFIRCAEEDRMVGETPELQGLIELLDRLGSEFQDGTSIRLGGAWDPAGSTGPVRSGRCTATCVVASAALLDHLALAQKADYEPTLVVMPWLDKQRGHFLRAFVRGRKLRAISAMASLAALPSDVSLDSLKDAVETYVQRELLPCLPVDDAAMDLWVARQRWQTVAAVGPIRLLDVQPLFATTDPGLFVWTRDAFRQETVEWRLR